MNDVVIVCDGDVVVTTDYIGLSLIVARGNITAKGGSIVTLMAGGKITLENKDRINNGPNSYLVEDQLNTLGVTFFELHRVGIEAKAAEKVVTLSAVKEKSAAALAGLKVGDVVVAVGAKKPADVEAFRRALRDALALGDATVRVTRDGKPVEVKLALPE
jgi:S1-C subfamily serine protease